MDNMGLANLLSSYNQYPAARQIVDTTDDSRVNITGDKGSRINIDNININSSSLKVTIILLILITIQVTVYLFVSYMGKALSYNAP